MANTFVYAEEYTTKLQERLSEKTKFKEICRVDYTNTKVLHNPYLTEATVQSYTRGSAYTMQDITQTDETVDITTAKILPQFIDRADLAQSGFLRQMELADKQGILLNEAIESALYADFANLTTFDNTELGGSAGSIQVSASNIDDIIRAMKRKIRKAGGESLYEQNGAFIVWRPEDLEILESFMQANGFNMADASLKEGAYQGIRYMGVDHYSSNLLTAQHVVGGVKKTYHIGILKDTYGQVMIDEKDPNLQSGISVVSRVDFKGKCWTKVKPVLYNIVVV
jgi:hypothetical protein